MLDIFFYNDKKLVGAKKVEPFPKWKRYK